MKATDIVDKFKKILLSETEGKVEEIEVKEDVQTLLKKNFLKLLLK